jgi:hypothetical protein
LTVAKLVKKVDSKSRTVQLNYNSAYPKLFEGKELTVQESWYRVAPRTHVIVVKSIESVNQPYEAAFVISPVDAADTSLKSASHVSLITRLQFEHRLKALVDNMNSSALISVETLYGLSSYLRGLSASDLNRLKSSVVGGESESDDRKGQDLEEEREFREILKVALQKVLQEMKDTQTYKQVLEKNGAKVYKKEGIADKAVLGFKAVIKMEKPMDVIMHFLSDITKYVDIIPNPLSDLMLANLLMIFFVPEDHSSKNLVRLPRWCAKNFVQCG